jgi:hypothetical protein
LKNISNVVIGRALGQSTDKMFRIMIEEGAPRPDYGGRGDFRVLLPLHSDVQDIQFFAFHALHHFHIPHPHPSRCP